MMITRWRPYNELANVYDRFNQLFRDDAFGEAGRDDVAQNVWSPLTDIFETKDEYQLKVDLPGFKKEDVKIDFNKDTLVISGERKEQVEFKNDECHRAERRYGKFSRSFYIPKRIELDKIHAALVDGILELKLPKAEEEKPKTIPIKIN